SRLTSIPQGEGSGTPTEPHHTPSPEAHQTSPTTYSLPTVPPVTTAPIPIELTDLCTSLQRQQSEMVFMLEAQELEINSLKARIKLLEDKDRGVTEHSGDDASIKGRNLDEGEAVVERVSDDTEEIATVLTSMDVAKDERTDCKGCRSCKDPCRGGTADDD
nr:hypothetical protein [Tanacetum cinerariifolium]